MIWEPEQTGGVQMKNQVHRQPDFRNILKVLNREVPDRPTLFEFFMNMNLYREAAGDPPPEDAPDEEQLAYLARAYAACGYDYVNAVGCGLNFHAGAKTRKETISLNEHAWIHDWESFYAYPWPDAKACDYSRLEKVAPLLPEGMKIMLSGPNGVLENVIDIVGYDNLCMMLYDEPELAEAIFEKVGSALVDYYTIGAQYDSVGMIMCNDDWGFNTQTLLSPDMLRKYVFPWHKKSVEAAHKYGKPAILHSCGYMADIMDDIIDDMKYDGRHSYEDNIVPVEEAYRLWGDRIAILGGLDVDFLIRSSDEEIVQRAKAMLEASRERGGYALGSGNSIPEYIPNGKYFAMTSAINLVEY